jgi:energy-converting hydrogenase A subunit R
MRVIAAFDLEGPLSPEDIAYDLMSVAPRGAEIFEVLSRYDDICALSAVPGYEPGYTLTLIVPFLLHFRIGEKDLIEISRRSTLVPGAKELMARLREIGFEICIVSTSYEQHANSIGERLDIGSENVFSTPFPLGMLREDAQEAELAFVRDIADEMLELRSDEEALIKRLDSFFGRLRNTPLGRAMDRVRVMGGRRKAEAIRSLAKERDAPLSSIACIGDSITDAAMLDTVQEAGGLAAAFNANAYALPHAGFALASESILPYSKLLEAWKSGGMPGARSFVRTWRGTEAVFHDMAESKFEDVLEVHKAYRARVRRDAAALG